jgi:hypothetical protein
MLIGCDTRHLAAIIRLRGVAHPVMLLNKFVGGVGDLRIHGVRSLEKHLRRIVVGICLNQMLLEQTFLVGPRRDHDLLALAIIDLCDYLLFHRGLNPELVTNLGRVNHCGGLPRMLAC